MRRPFSRLCPGKASALDSIGCRVLRRSASQLCRIFQYIFSLSLMTIPVLWKTSHVLFLSPRKIFDFSYLEVTEKAGPEAPLFSNQRSLDYLQFAYHPCVGVEVIILFMLNGTYTYLDKGGSYVRVMFFDFSSTFNPIQPALLRIKLLDMQVDAPVVAWLTSQLQGVRYNSKQHWVWSCLPFCLHSTHQTDTTYSPGTCRTLLMPLWVVSAKNMRLSTGVWWTVLWSTN